MGLAEDIAAEYPMFAWLLGDPEVGSILSQAVDPATEWSENRFLAKIQGTNWYRSRTEEARRMETLAHVDPATHQAQINAYGDEVGSVAANLGRWLDPWERLWLSTWGTNTGIAPNSASMKNEIRRLIKPMDVLSGYGTSGVAKQEISNVIEGTWFQPIADPLWLTDAATSVATGLDSVESINARMASQAWHMYPHLRPQIEAGQTMADIMNPYRQIIASELELGSAEMVDMQNPEWRQFMNWRDPQTGTIRLPTESEAITLARNKPQWWSTSKGRQTDAQTTNNILKMFGKVK